MQLVNGDCLEKMQDIPDKSVDMILADLPYGTSACKWDIVIPFKPLWIQYKRIIKDQSAIVLFGSEPFASFLRLSNLEWYKYDWVWEKTTATGFFDANVRPLKKHELILIFSNGGASEISNKKMAYYPQGLKTLKIPQKRIGTKKAGACRTIPSKEKGYQRKKNYPKSILRFPLDRPKIHPTQKPIALCKYLIQTYTNKGETVLDNVMGSGSTGVACIETGREFIGFEKHLEYFEMAKNRMKEAQIELL